MDIKNPEYILEIARQQSVTHAAEKLFVTQSTLSQYLLKLENELGTPLFSREKSGLVPTEAGHVYLHAARAVVQIQNAAEASIAALKKEGFLCVGVSFWGLTLLTGLLPAFKSRFPDITLRIFVDDYAHLKVMMQAGRIDLAVISITEEDDRPAQGAVNLRREELVVALPREAAYCLEHPDAEFISEKHPPHRGRPVPPADVSSPCDLRGGTGGQRHPNGGCRRGRGDFVPGGCPGRSLHPFVPAGSAAVPGEHHGAAPGDQADGGPYRAGGAVGGPGPERVKRRRKLLKNGRERLWRSRPFRFVRECAQARRSRSARDPWRFHRPER